MSKQSLFERCLSALLRHRRAFETFTRPATQLVLDRVSAPVAELLDLASGIGDPALGLAEHLRRHGTVTASDRVPALLRELSPQCIGGLDAAAREHRGLQNRRLPPRVPLSAFGARLRLCELRDISLALVRLVVSTR